MEQQTVLEGMAVRCGSRRDLTVRFGGYEGTIPRQDAVHPAISGAERDIAILSRVGKPTCFTITGLSIDGGGKPHLTLSRRTAQEQAIAWLLENSAPGTVLPARVTHLENFGAFVDLGCGVTSLIPLENISAARIPHPAARFRVGQDILVLVTAVDSDACRFYLSHKELLGTWMENAAGFAPGDAVTGIVRGVRDYGIFVELTPNLSGLADWRPGLEPGDAVSVYIKSIRPDTRKIKLQIIQGLGPAETMPALKYYITDGTVENWRY
ncbi:MAG: S1 RNA-binding domain-containing protein [Oscillospiraceae bacterium]|nr:S1 RNA-binding domain-containing protein [Oscillospiraceae bacterium]